MDAKLPQSRSLIVMNTMRPMLCAVALTLPLMVSGASGTANAGHPSSATPSVVTVGTYNVLKANELGVPSWQVRREKVQRTLLESGADVLALTEVTQHDVGGRTQREDVTQLLSSSYAPLIPNVDQCVRPRDAGGQLSGPNPCTHSTAIYFNPARARQAPSTTGQPASGRILASTVASNLSPAGGSREVGFAMVQPTVGLPFLLIAVHLPTEKTTLGEADRQAFASAVTEWGTQVARNAGYPNAAMVLAGDLNSYAVRQPKGAQWILSRNGWSDTYAGPVRWKLGGRFATINVTPATREAQGFPLRPFRYVAKREPTRIDYVFLHGSLTLVGYATVVQLLPDGRFDPAYQGSDHNMVLAAFTSP
jgi:endonuclease/exonuclease/phosphatase family metal-dependent hydrolase